MPERMKNEEREETKRGKRNERTCCIHSSFGKHSRQFTYRKLEELIATRVDTIIVFNLFVSMSHA